MSGRHAAAFKFDLGGINAASAGLGSFDRKLFETATHEVRPLDFIYKKPIFENQKKLLCSILSQRWRPTSRERW
jgi:hypothetical protein